MPCVSDYLEPTGQEADRREAARLLLVLASLTDASAPKWAKHAAEHVYGHLPQSVQTKTNADLPVQELCRRLTLMGPQGRRTVLYSDARNLDKRALAVWWEAHEAADKRRAKADADADEAELKRLRAAALAKLTPAERRALLGK